jgi:hypothetical protein
VGAGEAELGVRDDRWAPPVSGEKERGHTPSGFTRVGHGLPPGLVRNGSLRPFFIFILFSSFLFSISIHLRRVLNQIWFKPVSKHFRKI